MHSPDLLRITVEPLEDARLIRVSGEVDLSSAPALKRALDVARDEEATTLLDLSDVTFIDSTGLHLLLEASHRSATNGWAFFIVRPSEALQRLVALSGTADLLALVDSGRERVLD